MLSLSFSAALLATSLNIEDLSVQNVTPCNEGDRRVLHIGQLHQVGDSEANSILKQSITTSQKRIAWILENISRNTDDKLPVIIEGLTDDYDEETLLKFYRKKTLKEPIGEFFLYGEKYFAIEKKSDENLQLKKKANKLRHMYIQIDTIVRYNESYLEVQRLFSKDNYKDILKLINTWFPDEASWDLSKLRVKNLELFDQYKNILSQIVDLNEYDWIQDSVNFKHYADQRIKQNPYFAGADLMCSVQEKCKLIVGEDDKLNSMAFDILSKHGINSEQFRVIQEMRDDFVIQQIDKNWQQNQKLMTVVFGAAHDFGPNIEKWNQNNPDKQPFCLYNIDTSVGIDLPE